MKNDYEISQMVRVRLPRKEADRVGIVKASVVKIKTKKAGQQMLWVSGSNWDKVYYSSQLEIV